MDKIRLESITATTTKLKFNFENSNSWNFESYISSLNSMYGYQFLQDEPISVIPADLLCPIKDLNMIVYKLREYFGSILGCEISSKFDGKDFNGILCAGFGIYGNSYITITKAK